jgi:hypothetical protein
MRRISATFSPDFRSLGATTAAKPIARHLQVRLGGGSGGQEIVLAMVKKRLRKKPFFYARS